MEAIQGETKADLIVVVGGDGTLSQVVSGYINANGLLSGCTIGIIPAGTGGDFVRGMNVTCFLLVIYC